ncbi:UDP-N-acetylglucosamine--LPS N-acetylglucosamine transferase [Xylanibacillus composti]|uniref:UDP-glucuronosyltransferase n=1 Tax=Xylanibacillus composti TaxID=1572762 RepID=A0A8J4H3L4_9BACL|nr:glycosyltransferase [Xylanibacillus composti]MDT9724631.1 UDP-N-acetylglucosamine--LPS N-acetylglucosamine transferase [Xylanibacillus composti]GIQ70244.1 UDP-glucuronosyltransferase [Xylanibacillus composti]
MSYRRVLLLSEGFGTGHTQAAQALAVHLRAADSRVMPKVLELGSFLHPELAPLAFSFFRRTLIKRPKLYGKIYRHYYDKPLNRFAQLALHRLFYAQTAALLRDYQPDVIVSTHPFPSAVIARMKRQGWPVPLCTVITDYDAHSAWIHAETDAYLVPSKEVKEALIEKGVDPDTIEATGMPIHPSFHGQPDKALIRRQFGLRSMPTVLIMGGGWGLMGEQHLLEAALEWADQVQLVICLGNNRQALHQLRANPKLDHPNIRLLGYTDDIHQLMDVADLLITKPGGMTCSEAYAKGLPMLFCNPLPGQEEGNCAFFSSLGIAEKLDSAETLHRRFARLVNPRRPSETSGASLYTGQRPGGNPARCAEAVLRLFDAPRVQEPASLFVNTSTR